MDKDKALYHKAKQQKTHQLQKRNLKTWPRLPDWEVPLYAVFCSWAYETAPILFLIIFKHALQFKSVLESV